MYGEAGNDSIVGGADNDRIEGGIGNDTIRGLHGAAEESGGVFVHAAPDEDALYRDLTAYRRCLEKMRHDLGVDGGPSLG